MYTLSLEAHHRTITLEARTGTEASLQQALTRLPEFFKSARKKLVDAFSHPIDALFPAKNLAWAVAQLNEIPYPQMRSVDVPCVPGINVDYLTYTTRLADDARLCKRFEADYFDPFIDFLSRKLNNPDGLRSLAPDASIDHITMAELNVHNAAMGKLLTKDDKTSKGYSRVIRRNADWAEVMAHSKTIHEVFTQTDHDRFKAKAERANNLLGTLIQRLTHDHELYKISAPVLKTIVDKGYILAVAAEFYGFTYRRALVLDNALDLMIEAVKKKAA